MARDLSKQQNVPQSASLSSSVQPESTATGQLRSSAPGAGIPISGSDSDLDELLVTEVADQWLHVQWSVSHKTLARAESSMGRESHRSQRVLRLHRIDQGESRPPSKELQLQVDVTSDAQEWFVRIPDSYPTWLVEYGVVFGKNRFFSMLHSSPITLSLIRPAHQKRGSLLASPSFSESIDAANPTPLQVKGTFVLQGETRRRARLLIDDRDVPVDPQTGKFEWQLPLANGRVVIPIRVTDTNQIRRALLALETNFHLLDPEPPQDD